MQCETDMTQFFM